MSLFRNTLSVKICIGLAPLKRIGPRPDVGGLTGAKSGEVFFRSDGRADGGQKEK